MCVCFATALWHWTQFWQEEKRLLPESPPRQKGDLNLKRSCDVERPFGFRNTSPSLVMPTLPEEDEESPEEMDSSSSSPRTSTPSEGRAIVFAAPTIIYPQQVTAEQVDRHSLEQARPHSPRARLARKPSGGPITTVDSTGNVIDLLRDPLPEPQLSEEDRQKNLELLEQAKKVSDRFLSRRGRRSTSSLTESPTVLSPCPTPPSSSPSSSRSSSVIVAPQTVAASSDTTHVSSQSAFQHRDVPLVREQSDSKNKDLELLVEWKPSEKRKVSSGTLTPRFAVQKENSDLAVPKSTSPLSKVDEVSGRNPNQAPATGVAKPVPRPPTQQAPCTAEIKTIGAFPPLMRAVSWDAVGSINARNGSPSFPPTLEEPLSDEPREAAFKSSGYKDFPTQPGGVRKLTKLREEHKLMRNQSIVGSKLPELSEATEQEKGTLLSSKSGSIEEGKENAMPNISDVMLRKLKLHRGLPGCAPPLSEKEVENAFVQLSLAFRNDNYTLETRLKQAERERNLTEEETEKELEEFKGALKMTSPQWQNMEQRDSYQRLIETVAVLHRLATRLSSRAEIVGAVRQEKRMNKATEVMMQYVENLKRIYEKDHAELMEFKKLANQNSNRCYTGTVETGDDGVPRTSRAMSLTLGKALPRRRVSVAVVPKFSLINAPGQTPATAPTAAALPALCETNDVKSSSSPEGIQPAAPECGKTSPEQESESAKPSTNLEEIRAEIRAEIAAKIEEEAYQRGLKDGQKQSKVILEDKCEEETDAEKQLEHKNNDEELGKRHHNMRRMEEAVALLGRLCPKVSISRRILWIALTLFVVMCVVISIFTFFSDYYKRREDTGTQH
ncbi:Protein MRVI1 [Oryzias melastigma]|uniref:Protein MRVI1 n=1 Tax=Oryzias melastigma TaxID=30732 RepID=A0A834F2K5_ORYME|nr:Protein MRVI1 [Oryzias melastigma]